MCKTKPDSLFGQFCHYTLVHVPSVTQEITKDKQKKTINLHNYFNILFFKYCFSNICLNLSLNFYHLSQWRHVFMYVCKLCPGAQNQIAPV